MSNTQDSPARRLVAAIDELIAFVIPRLMPSRRISNDEFERLINIEGQIVGLVAISHVGQLIFQNRQPNESRHAFTQTGLEYYYSNSGVAIFPSFQWKAKMRTLRVAAQVVADADTSVAAAIDKQTSLKNKRTKSRDKGRRPTNDDLLDFDENERRQNPRMTDKEMLEAFRMKHSSHPVFDTSDPQGALRAARSRRGKKRPPT